MKIWTVIYQHRFGVNTYLFGYEPTEEQAIARIEEGGDEFEPDRESIDIVGPETCPCANDS